MGCCGFGVVWGGGRGCFVCVCACVFLALCEGFFSVMRGCGGVVLCRAGLGVVFSVECGGW